jgi:hypothetical protein
MKSQLLVLFFPYQLLQQLQSSAICADAPVTTSAFPDKPAVSIIVMPYTPAQQKADEATAAQGTHTLLQHM